MHTRNSGIPGLTESVAGNADSDPFPQAGRMFEAFAETAITGRARRRLFITLLSLLGVVRAAERARLRMLAVARSGVNPFERNTVSRNFSGLYPELSFSVLLEDGDADPFLRAGKLVCAALEYRDSALERRHQAADESSAVHRELRDSHIFGRVVTLLKTRGGWRKRISDYPESAYIIVATAGRFFTLHVYEEGAAIAPGLLSSVLRAIAEHAANMSAPRVSYGALTAVVTKDTLELLDAASTPAIQSIDAALFVLALDLDAAPDDINAAGQQVHIGGYGNRDYRKSFQLVVCGNGKAGAVFNLFAGVEGVTAAQFISTISQRASAMGSCHEPAAATQLAHLDLPGNAIVEKQAESRMRQVMLSVPHVHRIDSMSKDRMKALGVSPDAFFHLAAHLAYVNSFGRVPEAHNFIDLRMLKYGSISRYPCTTVAMRKFLRSQTRADLLQAVQAHKDTITAVRAGGHPLHYIYHYLFSPPGLAAGVALVLMTLFMPGFKARYLSPDLWLSNIPALPGVQVACRLGVALSFLRKHAYTGHYLLFPDHIRICFLSRDDDGVRAWNVKEELEKAFMRLETILHTDPNNSGA